MLGDDPEDHETRTLLAYAGAIMIVGLPDRPEPPKNEQHDLWEVALRSWVVASRHRLHKLLGQQARLGQSAPYHLIAEIESVRATIQTIRAELRNLGATVEDAPEDK